MKKILIPIGALLITHSAHAQLTQGENYVYSKTYLDYNAGGQPTKTSETVQYIDGLGRPKQVVNVKASPLGKDIVSHIEYDQFGRQTKDYLPVPQSGTLNGAIVPTPLANATQSSIYGSEKIYSEKVLENSPLDRIQQQIQVGNDWTSKPVKFGYDAVTTADAVKKFATATTWENGATKSIPSNAGIYQDGQLYKNSITDEDQNKTIEFKNGRGQLILLRKIVSASENADTYYVYNEYNQLAFVVPPLLAKIQSWSQADQDNLVYEYRYDGRNRLVEKKLPGKGWEYMVYDRADRLVLTQDANLRAQGKWLFTKYDQFSRPIYSGILDSPPGRIQQVNAIDGIVSNTETRSSSSWNNSGMDVFYTNSIAYPSTNFKLLSVNYYDTYPLYSFNPSVSDVLGEPILTGTISDGKSTKGLPVMSLVKNIEDDNWTKNYTYYDTRGRAIGSYSINHLGGYTRTESKLDFAGVPQAVVTKHKRLETDTERIITENFTYDNQNRMLFHKHQVDGNPEEILTQNKYNELSQLESKKVGGITISSPLQTIDYKYNIRGWMTQINDPANLGSDLFGYKINYNQVEGLEVPNAEYPDLKVKPKYNGNISEVSWKTRTEENEALKRYGYTYDSLSRLSAGFYQKAGNESAKEYFEMLEYDFNGNITRLKRSAGLPAGNTTALAIDNLRYDYIGNKLIRVTDEQQNTLGYPYLATPGIIGYDNDSGDGNGNMINHTDKGISSIQYNYLNLPQQVIQNTEITKYTYRADGVKVKKLFKNLETDYLDGFQYKSTFNIDSWDGNGTYHPDPNEIPVLKLRIIPTSEGYYDALFNKYVYNFTDHLGNMRLSYTDTSGDGIIQPRMYNASNCSGKFCFDDWRPGEIVDVNNYYPFGLLHNYTATTQNAYQYKYQGQELQETGFYSFKWREYMPDVGRFIQLDPLAEKFPYNSTYAIQENKMGMGIELEGLELLPHHSGYFAIGGNQMTVKQAPVTQRDSFGRPSFRAGDIGLSTSGYNPGGARMSSGTTGLKLNSYRYSGPTPSSAKMESVRGDDRPTNIWTKTYDKGLDKAGKLNSGIKELYKLGDMAANIPDAIKSTSNYTQATKDVNSVLDQAGVMGDAINYVDSSGMKMGTQLRNDVVNYVFDGTLPAGTDTQNGLIIQNGTSVLNSNNLPIRPTPGQVQSMLENKQKEIQNQVNSIPH